MPPLIELHAVSCSRPEGGVQSGVTDISMIVAAGTVTMLVGKLGCGKNLLLRLLGLLEVPDSGEVFLEGKSTAHLTDDERAELRARMCGYVFAAPFLLCHFNVAENIAMPIFKVSQLGPEAAQERTEDLIRFAGLEGVAMAKEVPAALQHRVSLARALCNEPAVLFVENIDALPDPADVPAFRALLHEAARRYGVAVVVTALPSIPTASGERRLEICGGRISGEATS